ncbi:MAG: DUF3576 domain-containing protein [Alphaproteobacteria bacterium]|nr:DUF3576 domain-containing protein [Alphaproteobacteria bacterium]
MNLNKTKSFLGCCLVSSVIGCSNSNLSDETDNDTLDKEHRRDAKLGTLFGDDALVWGREQNTQEGGGSIGVNHYLWRASLDTLSFMPLRSADPFGGVIMSEWYTAPESTNERFKVDIMILDRQLRANGVRVSVHKQIRDPQGEWKDKAVEPQTNKRFEDAILTRARQLKINGTKA